MSLIYPFKPNGFSNSYQLDQSIFIIRVVGWYFSFFKIFIELSISKQCNPDQTLHSSASGLGLHCLPMSHKEDARLIWINTLYHLL